jgi:hypothetical protein
MPIQISVINDGNATKYRRFSLQETQSMQSLRPFLNHTCQLQSPRRCHLRGESSDFVLRISVAIKLRPKLARAEYQEALANPIDQTRLRTLEVGTFSDGGIGNYESDRDSQASDTRYQIPDTSGFGANLLHETANRFGITVLRALVNSAQASPLQM